MTTAPEHERALFWRKHVVKLTRDQLSELVGVSVSRIADIEAGKSRANGAPIDAATMTRYRMACAAVTLGVSFDWTSLKLRPNAPVEITMTPPAR